jgi:hypothetical protein
MNMIEVPYCMSTAEQALCCDHLLTCLLPEITLLAVLAPKPFFTLWFLHCNTKILFLQNYCRWWTFLKAQSEHSGILLGPDILCEEYPIFHKTTSFDWPVFC